ncbi:MAG: 4Fe-4S binding protein, partial [Nitrososphaerota archaeon]|nr:4Fe-4S binding protein [Nitrososphaerota archaeon]
MINRNIEQVVTKELCTGCGTCVSICPTKAVTIKLDNRLGVY